MNQEVIGKLRAKTAALRYGNPGRMLRIIAVAGAAGKTTTACLIAEILKEADRSVMLLTNRGIEIKGEYSDGHYDSSPDALQRYLAQAKKDELDFVILEVTDALVKTQVLATIPIDTAVVTNASYGATALLDQPVNYAVVPSGYLAEDLGIAPHQLISYGQDETAEARINSVKLYRRGTEVNLTIDHQTTFDLASYLVGRANALNVAAATAAAYVLSVDLETLNEGVARLEQVSGNYQYIDVEAPYSIVVDGAANDTSLEMVIDSAKQLTKRRLLVVVEATGVSDETLRHIQKVSERVIAVAQEDLGITGVTVSEHTDEALRLILRGAKQDELVLLVGPSFAARNRAGETLAEELVGGQLHG